jgi:hypothetical protein
MEMGDWKYEQGLENEPLLICVSLPLSVIGRLKKPITPDQRYRVLNDNLVIAVTYRECPYISPSRYPERIVQEYGHIMRVNQGIFWALKPLKKGM